MALIPKVSGCTLDCCKYFRVSDVTGQYHVTTNPGGWGTPNIDPSGVTDVVLTLLYPDGVTSDVIDSTDTTRYATLMANITGATTFPFELYVFTSLSGTSFPDGIYTITLTYTATATTYTANSYMLSDCLVACCVDNMFAQLPNKMCDTCNYTEFLNNALLAKALLTALRASASCADSTKTDAILKSLQKICAWADCACG